MTEFRKKKKTQLQPELREAFLIHVSDTFLRLYWEYLPEKSGIEHFPKSDMILMVLLLLIRDGTVPDPCKPFLQVLHTDISFKENNPKYLECLSSKKRKGAGLYLSTCGVFLKKKNKQKTKQNETKKYTHTQKKEHQYL